MKKKQEKSYSTEILFSKEDFKMGDIRKIHIEIETMTLNKYLTNYSKKRSIDTVFVKWFQRQDPLNPLKSKAEWDKLVKKFLNEVV